jgi:thiol-disulfide isomerase/thioredoxin
MRKLAAVGIGMAALLGVAGRLPEGAPPQDRRAPELDGGIAWFNTDRPLRMTELRGKVVLLDFWTFCCINCMHVFPDLKRLERKYPSELVVIGVHSAKFKNEQDSENIRQAILRHNIEHPVVNDAQFKLFRAFEAKGWPAFVVIDPEGRIVKQTGGEGRFDVLDQTIAKLIEKYGDKIDRKPPQFALEKAKATDAALAYPGKLVATADRLYIADTNHHRILVCDHAGKVLAVVGGPDHGAQDGDFGTARFYQPQGLALGDSKLYVADTENHLIREIDFERKTVRTIAGTGKQVYHREYGAGDPLRTPCNSPWDLVLDQNRLLIAMAGDHQIWQLDLARNTLGPLAGSGDEDISDGPFRTAEFAQPSGLSLLGSKLYVADAEVSGVREVDLKDPGQVRTIVGKGLFDFGDRDGKGDDVRLQHCLAVHAFRGKLYIADSYNHKIKVCDPATREVRTLLGDGKRGVEDGTQPRFYEPSGLSGVGDRLFIADQNNHRIRVCDLKTGQVSTVAIEKR